MICNEILGIWTGFENKENKCVFIFLYFILNLQKIPYNEDFS